MADVIARIVEVEKQCTEEIENAQREYTKKVEAYRHTLEEKKQKEFAAIISAGNERLAQALAEVEEQARREFVDADRENELLVADVKIKEAIKEKIVSILISG